MRDLVFKVEPLRKGVRPCSRLHPLSRQPIVSDYLRRAFTRSIRVADRRHENVVDFYILDRVDVGVSRTGAGNGDLVGSFRQIGLPFIDNSVTGLRVESRLNLRTSQGPAVSTRGCLMR